MTQPIYGFSPMKRWGLAIALLLYFVFIGFASLKKPLARWLPPSRFRNAVDAVGFLSGSSSHYGFFAPGVVSEFVVQYDLLAGGKVVGSSTLTTDNSEATFRLYNIVQNFWLTQTKDTQDLRRSLAASLAGKVLGAHPEADGIRLIVKAHVLPSMSQYRAGDRPRWETHYQVEFHRETSGKII